MPAIALTCTQCHAEYPIGPMFHGCPLCRAAGTVAALGVTYDYDAIARALNINEWNVPSQSHSIWRFRALLPVSDPRCIVSLGEGNTALVRPRVVCEETGLNELYIKNETTNPTWAFKDRFHAASISMAKALGFTKVTASTTGNHGSSAAAYAAAAGMASCAIFCHPESSVLQRNMIQLYGGTAFVLKDRDRYLEALVTDHGYYPSTTMEPMPVGTPYGVEGYKTIGYEIFLQLGRRVPDHLFCPISAGDSLYGPWKGFRELRLMGISDRLPRMHGAQAAGCNPYVRSFQQGLNEVVVHPDPRSIALSIRDEMGGKPALQAIYESGGDATDVTDEEILHAVRLLARSGFLVEPSSAASVACAMKASREGRIRRDQTVVCLITGSGAKWPEVLAGLVDRTAPVEPTWGQIQSDLSL
ncbi:MAG: pyridoxal-phosphate dependent enzyme [Candidatus Latescibacteria bacterium]|nr:pyridoxal-phosphate dependent enzyme [Candidatus Latescibacterota bacterium]